MTTGTRFEDEFPYDVPQKGRLWFRQQVVPVGEGIAISLRDITAWKNAGDKIRESEERLRLALAAAHMGAWSADAASDTYTLSEEAGPIFGLPEGAGPRSTEALLETVHPDDREALASGIERSRATAQGARREFRVVWPDGSVHWVETHGNVICDEAGKPVRTFGVFVDITQRKLDVATLQRANRALKTLSAGNGALVRATAESELLQEICHAIVDKGGYRMAWVGYPQNDLEKTIVPMGWAGVEDDYFNHIRLTWADDEQGQRPVSRALRRGETQTSQDVRTDARFASVRELVSRPGYDSNLALPLLDGKKVIGVMSIFASEADAFDDAEVRLLQELATDLVYGIGTLRTREERDRIAHAHKHHEAILRKSLEDSIQAIAATVEMRDPYTSGHQKRVAELAVAIAREMGLPEERIHGLHLAGIVHDLGKISVPAEILAKPGKLTAIEFQLIQGHAQAGYEILKDIDFPWPIATIVRQHHERLDGTGYPQGLKGEDILLESRIMAVADVVEAMASHRPYRPTLGIEFALQEIERGRGTRYDPVVADACLKVFRDDRYVLAA
jgi:PAS domain S-box-containing protein/putative nucleotidyltransferase with HDIG domain